MRMWMVPPQIMCKGHLLGEHSELHMAVGSWEHGHLNAVIGHADAGQIDTRLLYSRHEALAREMARRKWNHNSPLIVPVDMIEVGQVDVVESLRELLGRCEACRERFARSFIWSALQGLEELTCPT